MSVADAASQRRIHSIYSDHHGWLFGWLRRKTSCPHDAADLAHDTFLRVIAGRDLLELREPRAYLLVIASRLLINQNRRRKVEEEALRQIAVLMEIEDAQDPQRIAETQDLLSQVLLLLTNELPEKVRRAFLMARLEGMSYAAIAAKLDVSESSVKQYLARALAHCHARLFDSLQG